MTTSVAQATARRPEEPGEAGRCNTAHERDVQVGRRHSCRSGADNSLRLDFGREAFDKASLQFSGSKGRATDLGARGFPSLDAADSARARALRGNRRDPLLLSPQRLPACSPSRQQDPLGVAAFLELADEPQDLCTADEGNALSRQASPEDARGRSGSLFLRPADGLLALVAPLGGSLRRSRPSVSIEGLVSLKIFGWPARF
jgi:hypothetical protein